MRSPAYDGLRALLNRPDWGAARVFCAGNTAFHLSLLVAVSLATRILYLISPAGRSLSPDEAVFGLMALKIMALEEFPIYCWQAHYAGAPVSYAAALLFKVFGIGALSLRAPMLPLALATVVLCYFVYRRLAGPAFGFAAALFVVFCPYDMLFHSSGAFGGYAELLCGTAAIIGLTRWMRERKEVDLALGWFFLLGAISGFSLYVIFLVFPAIAAFAIPAVLRADARRIPAAATFAFGAILGALPMLVYNATTGGSTVLRAAGRSLSVGRQAASEPLSSVVATVVLQKIDYLAEWFRHAPGLFGSYITPESVSVDLRMAAGYLLMGILCAFVGWALWKRRSTSDTGRTHRDFAIFVLWTVGFIWLANLTKMRHLIPLYLALPVALHALSGSHPLRRRFAIACLVGICAVNASSWVDQLKVPTAKTPFDPAHVVAAMESRGVVEFYGAYWAVYPLMFSAEGRMIGAPLLLNAGDTFTDRRPEYTARVKRATDPAYVFTAREAPLRVEFETFLQDNDIAAETLATPNATIFHNLSRPVIADLVDGKTVFTL